MGAISLSNVLQALTRLVAGVALVLAGFGVLGAVAAYAASVFLASFLSLMLLYLRMRGIGGSWLDHFVPDIRTMLSYGFLVFFGLLAINISSQYVVLVLAAIASNSYVGYYQSAVNVVTAITLTYNAIGQTLFPAFAHLDGTKGDIARAFRYATKYMGFILTPIIFLLMGTAPQLIRVLLGASYGQAALYLFILSFSYIPVLFGYAVLPSLFGGVGRARLAVFFSVVNAGVLLVLAPLLGIDAHLGVPGLIYATLVANVAGTAAGLLLASRYLNARMDLRAAFSILMASLLAFLLVFALRYLEIEDVALLLLQVVVFAAAYLTLAPLVRAIGLDDIRALDASLVGLGRGKALVNPILRYEEFILRLLGRH
jgi:O-antigen/teichoic acid export membrane protein